ncbi:zinc finger CCCH domain-containing protein 18-like [Salvia divinorum]|uniref:Zinc finger CCCH domain-containing protein 18-like n=1 Tax=Salvia divinorum TaxID=28513 RepID=A0ABD1HHF4_SALDI
MHRYARFRAENGHELQLYLTFPPESTFSEQDMLNYFNNFGPVQEVRIPSQVQRMFRVVALVYPETAALVLTKTNPHYICGSQAPVKPYRFKPFRYWFLDEN